MMFFFRGHSGSALSCGLILLLLDVLLMDSVGVDAFLVVPQTNVLVPTNQRHRHEEALRRRGGGTVGDVPWGRRGGGIPPGEVESLSRRRMFTGIVEEMGTVVSLEHRDDMTLWDGSKGSGTELTVRGDVVTDGAYLGCSICVSGVCLTATDLIDDDEGRPTLFKVGLAPETLRRTYLGELVEGDKVNLERASEIGGRNSGHFVQGHVDGTGEVVDRWVDANSLFYKIKVDSELIPYIVPKGFIAVDGTSLTVVDVDTKENCFTFMLVEYTQKKIIIPAKMKGDAVNLEVDVLGKYSENAMASIVPRLEALEATVEKLERRLAKLEGS